jgi:hypothetical protein
MRFRKKPVVIEAFLWTGDQHQVEDPEWACEAISTGQITFVNSGTPQVALQIHTLEGVMTAQRGDWIIRGVKGEIYPCKPDIFTATYDTVASEPARPKETEHSGPCSKYGLCDRCMDLRARAFRERPKEPEKPNGN